MADRLQFDDRFFDRVGKGPGVNRLGQLIAQRVLATARANAPVDTGDYQRSMHIERRVSRHRVVYRVVASDRKALLIESRRGVLARALRAGLRR